MLQWNVDLSSAQKLVNGSRGVVVEWKSKAVVQNELSTREDEHGTKQEDRVQRLANFDCTHLPVVKFHNGRVCTVHPEEFKVCFSPHLEV